MDSPPQYPNPNSTPKVLHPLMLNAMSTAKGAGLARLVKDGFLKECFSLGSEYNNKGSWKLQCLYCQKEISTGEGRTQNVLMHLARQHLDLLDLTVIKEVVKVLATPDKEEKINPVARHGLE